MNRIAAAFAGKKALIPLLAGGDPDIATTEKLILAMAEAGADMIAIGVPFSDPVAEGIVIQEVNARALANGCTVDRLFAMVKRLRCKVSIPLLIKTYINPVYTYGTERFFAECQQSGIDGIIVPDLPFEEKDELEGACKHHNICLISVIATTSAERVTKIAQEAKGFLYCVSAPGAADIAGEIRTNITGLIRRAKKITDLPCVLECDTSTPEQAQEMLSIADGVIISGAVFEMVAAMGSESVEAVKQYLMEMKMVNVSDLHP